MVDAATPPERNFTVYRWNNGEPTVVAQSIEGLLVSYAEPPS
jgi:hypothetical protein